MEPRFLQAQKRLLNKPLPRLPNRLTTSMTLKNGLSEELNRQGNEHFARGHYTDAYACYAKALECDRLTGDHRALSATLANLGNLRADAGEWERARAYYLEALDIMTREHDELGKAVLFSDLGLVAREM